MPVDPEDFLDFAKRLLGIALGGSREAHYRTVINRSYLASVLKAANLLGPLVGPLPRDHEFYVAVERGLMVRGAPRSKNKPFDLRRRRRDADYELALTLGESAAQAAINVADDLFSLLAQEVV